VRVDLPIEWAKRHTEVSVAFKDWSRDNWHVYVVGDDAAVLLSFPWDDHADRMLREADADAEFEEFPVIASKEAWEELEQEWFVWVRAHGDDVYMAEGSSDDMDSRVRNARRLALVQPGIVSVDGFEVTWNVTNRFAYDQAWRNAIASCREGQPSPLLPRSGT
jgi:hypothetical protein